MLIMNEFSVCILWNLRQFVPLLQTFGIFLQIRNRLGNVSNWRETKVTIVTSWSIQYH